MKTVPLLVICLFAAAADNPASDKRKPAGPPIGRELSSVPGVSIVGIAEVAADQGPRVMEVSSVNEAARLMADGHTLLEVLTQASGLHAPRVFLRAALPGGDFRVMVRTETGGREELFRMLRQACNQAFGVRMALEERDIDVLVLEVAGNWARDGFRPTNEQRTSMQWWHSGPPGENRLHWMEFHGDLNAIAGQLERILGKVVINETGVGGQFAGRLEYREGALLADLEYALRRHGLAISPAVRKAEALFIEPAPK